MLLEIATYDIPGQNQMKVAFELVQETGNIELMMIKPGCDYSFL